MSFSVLLLSCSKSETNIDPDKVQVRIQNATGFTLENAKVAGINYGDISNRQLTDYKVMNEPIYAGIVCLMWAVFNLALELECVALLCHLHLIRDITLLR